LEHFIFCLVIIKIRYNCFTFIIIIIINYFITFITSSFASSCSSMGQLTIIEVIKFNFKLDQFLVIIL